MFRRNLTFLLAAAGICLMGCQDELIKKENGQPAAGKNAISFTTGGIGEFEPGEGEGQSRTAYGTGSIGEDGKWRCPLDWVYGDRVRVYCDEASADTHADYSVVWDNGQEGQVQGSQNRAYLQTTGNTLCWGDPSKAHTFYAFYPATMIQEDADAQNLIINGEIPNTQTPTFTFDAESKTWKGTADMNYAIMSADTTIAPENIGDPVSLHFKPLITALQINLKIGDNLTLGGVNSYLSNIIIEAPMAGTETKQALCGHFKYDLKQKEFELTDNPYETNNHQISVNLKFKENELVETALPIESGQTIEFTVFLLPGQTADNDYTIDNLTVKVMGFGVGGVWTSEIPNADIKVGTVNRLTLEGYSTNAGANNWMAVLDDNIKLSQLSIPGSVSAFTRDITYEGENQYTYTKGDEMDVTQWIRMKPGGAGQSQFDLGVRAFEIETTVERDGWDYPYKYKLPLVAGKIQDKEKDLPWAIGVIRDELLNSPSEFAVVIPYYNNAGGGEEVSNWIKTLTDFITTYNTTYQDVEITPFRGDMTVGEARGKILMLARYPETLTTLKGEDLGSYSLSNISQYVTFITEWDLDKDRWYKRGYEILEEDIMPTPLNGRYMWWEVSKDKNEYQWTGKTKSGESTSVRPMNGHYKSDNWTYHTYVENEEKNYHVLEWERVCGQEGRYDHSDVGSYTNHYSWTYWYNSIDKRIEYIQQFMEEAGGALKNPNSSEVYINSLRGYYIVENGYSALPWDTGGIMTSSAGLHGDIPPCAQELNSATYKYISSIDNASFSYEKRGPVGIILMNYAGVSNQMHDDFDLHGDKLLNAIIDNNFRFLLQTAASDAE